ncbi:DUF5050 domain-containing protein [Sporomusa termitida]|uniref:N-acetylmuramoyl-L-alanine amidase CwlD n=1 Tax=Sporomusa termitida TaxID=2377 RepID=A0A517E0R4_9FIRM|nr:DUF5050 domain-containing protein [Sporomusa termitida]QDR83168.1 N-acetylmuramoyl-L-alanine amidase CwlD [Sporomusa termitida]
MPVQISLLPLLLAITLLFCPGPAAAGLAVSAPAAQSATELKLFQLEHTDAVAIAVETRQACTALAADDRLEPEYRVTRQGSTVAITLAARPAMPELAEQGTFTKAIASSRVHQVTIAAIAANELSIAIAYNRQIANLQIVTVKRKPLPNPDNTVTHRTYLVLRFTDSGTDLPATIVLDPGHGGPDLGTTSNFLREKDLNLDIARLSRDLFAQHGYDVYMTRTDDSRPSLLDRADAANILEAAALISIHNNSVPADKAVNKLSRGTTALYNSSAPRPAQDLATLIAANLAQNLRIPQSPLQDRPGLVLLNATWIPAVIAEIAMLPHPQDAKLISRRVYRLEAAKAIVQATDDYFNRRPQPRPAPAPAVAAGQRRTLSSTRKPLYYLALAPDPRTGIRENIHRLNPGATAPTVLSSDEAWSLNISGKYLYYSNWSDNHRIYRLSRDGKEKTRITDAPVSQVVLTGNWLVYIQGGNRHSAPANFIYKTSLDGQVTQQLNCDPSENLSLSGDWVYYLNAADGYRIYKVKLDGSGRSKVGNDRAISLTAAGKTIYYSNYDDGQKLYAIGTDGQNRTKLTDDKTGFIAIAGNDIYYTNTSANHALYQLNATTKKQKLICDLGVGPQPVIITNKTLYYHHLFFRL